MSLEDGPPGLVCRLCPEQCRFIIFDTESSQWLPGYCANHGASMLRPYENSTVAEAKVVDP